MDDLLREYFALHVLLNATYVSVGIVVARYLAWKTGVERRYAVRRQFVLLLLLIALVFSVLITALTPDSRHLVLGIAAGLAAGLATAFWSRGQAGPAAPRKARPGASHRPR